MRQLLKNLFYRFGLYIVGVLIALSATPKIVSLLGIASYGFISIINTVIAYSTIITVSLTSSIGRNLIFYFKNNNYKDANREIVSIIYTLILIFLILVPLLCFLSESFINRIGFNGEDRVGAKILLITSVTCSIFGAISGVLSSIFFAKNRLDLQSISSFIYTLIINVFLVLLLYFKSDFTSYSISILIANVVLFFYNYYRSNKLFRVDFSLHNFSFSFLRKNVFFSLWILINQLGVLLFLQSELLLINHFFGLVNAGMYSIVVLVCTQIRNVSSIFSGLFSPVIIKSISECNTQVNLIIRKTSLMNILFTSMFCALIAGTTDDLLPLWLGNEYLKINMLMEISIFLLAINMFVTPYWNVLLAYREVKIPAIITIVLGLANILTSILLINEYDFGMLSVVMSANLFLFIKNLLIMPKILGSRCGVDIKIFYFDFIGGLFLLSFYFFFVRFISCFMPAYNWFQYLSNCVLCLFFLFVFSVLYLKVAFYRGADFIVAIKKDIVLLSVR